MHECIFFPGFVYIHILYIFVDEARHNHQGVLHLNCLLECPPRYNHCKNAGGLKTHMGTHKKPETKSEPLLKWVVKHAKSEIMPSAKLAIELKPILGTETPKTTRL